MDADLIMLGLASHEARFLIIREEVLALSHIQTRTLSLTHTTPTTHARQSTHITMHSLFSRTHTLTGSKISHHTRRVLSLYIPKHTHTHTLLSISLPLTHSFSLETTRCCSLSLSLSHTLLSCYSQAMVFSPRKCIISTSSETHTLRLSIYLSVHVSLALIFHSVLRWWSSTPASASSAASRDTTPLSAWRSRRKRRRWERVAV